MKVLINTHFHVFAAIADPRTIGRAPPNLADVPTPLNFNMYSTSTHITLV